MIDRAAATIRAQLVAGEELLWTGAPRSGLWARPGMFWGVVVSPVLTYIWIVNFAANPAGGFSALPIVGVVYLAFMVGFVYDVARRRGASYGLSDRRAISVYWLLGMRVESANLDLVADVTVAKRPDGSGTITFGFPPEYRRGFGFDSAFGDWPLTGPLVFDMIENAGVVAAKIETARAERREKRWRAAAVYSAPSLASSGNIKIAYLDAGIGDPIVFLHGVGATKRCWAMQMSTLARKFRCIALDYRGYGESDLPPLESISREAYARDVAAVMDAAAVDRAVLCGNSLGGVVALEFYKQFPKRVESLVLVDSFAYYPGGAESIPDRIKTLDELGIEQFAVSRSAALFGPDAPAWLVESARADLASIPLPVYKASTRVTWSGDYRDLLPKVGVAALVLWGEYDTKIAPRALSEELARCIPACSDVTDVPRAGHIPQMENPLAFNALLADFLS